MPSLLGVPFPLPFLLSGGDEGVFPLSIVRRVWGEGALGYPTMTAQVGPGQEKVNWKSPPLPWPCGPHVAGYK